MTTTTLLPGLALATMTNYGLWPLVPDSSWLPEPLDLLWSRLSPATFQAVPLFYLDVCVCMFVTKDLCASSRFKVGPSAVCVTSLPRGLL